jgi:hypothetical protein
VSVEHLAILDSHGIELGLMSVSYLAALGAIVTILASLTGFFSQQLVLFQDCLEKDPTALVNISRTNTYVRIAGIDQDENPVDYIPMVAAINIGLLQPPGDLTNALSSGCSSGNCTFSGTDGASFSTVAITHLCEDITAHIRVVNVTKQETYLGLDYGYNKTFAWRNRRYQPLVRSWTDKDPSQFREDYRQNSSDLLAIYFLFRSHQDSTDWKVANCTLFPTVNTYAASIKDAILEESLIDSVHLQAIGVQFNQPPVFDRDLYNLRRWWSHRMTTNYTIRDGVRESCVGLDSPATGLVRFMKSSDEPTYTNSTKYTNPSAGWKWWYYPEGCIWSISEYSLQAIVHTLNEVFSFQDLGVSASGGGITGPAQLRVLFEGGNITLDSVNARMKDLATSMTTVFRTSGGDGNATSSSAYARGDVWITTTCMYIRWPWIAFSVAMIGLTGVFLMLVAFENRSVENDRLWKSSFLAALFCEVEVNENPVGKEEMRAIAKSTSVSIEGKSGILRLIAA